jgi:cytochrome c oxidase subunit 2
MGRRLRAGRLLPLVFLLGVGLLLAGCDPFSSPQNTFNPGGTVAEQQKNDFLFVMWPALVVGVGVMLAIVYIFIKFRRKSTDTGLPKQVHGNTPLELTWTIIPAIMMAVIAVPTVAGIRELARDPAADALKVEVGGQRFSWQFSYPDIDAGGAPLFTVNELYIPVDREIGLTIDSVDVNHSFWVPKLAGKTDAIANHTNHMWIEATETGTYQGQCAEFCGLNHAEMRFRVVVLEQPEFDAWVADQQQQAAARQEAAQQVGVAAGE